MENVLVTLAKSDTKGRFDRKNFLANINADRVIAAFPKKATIFAKGDVSDAVFYVREGKVKLTVVSKIGREATMGILNEGDFFGEGCLTGQVRRPGILSRDDRHYTLDLLPSGMACGGNRQFLRLERIRQIKLRFGIWPIYSHRRNL